MPKPKLELEWRMGHNADGESGTCWVGPVCVGGYCVGDRARGTYGAAITWKAYFGTTAGYKCNPWESAHPTSGHAKGAVEDFARIWMMQVAEAVNAEA